MGSHPEGYKLFVALFDTYNRTQFFNSPQVFFGEFIGPLFRMGDEYLPYPFKYKYSLTDREWTDLPVH